MKKLSEVCKLAGVTRRTMQEYDRIGLLSPTSKTESGYWLYDDDAISVLFGIQLFVAAGYERKAIKKMLESPTVDVLAEYDSIIERLKEKRNRIDGLIKVVDSIRRIGKILERMPFEKCNQNKNTTRDLFALYKDKSFAECLDDWIISCSEDGEIVEVGTLLSEDIIAIGCLNEKHESDDSVQTAVEHAFGSFALMIKQINEDDDDPVDYTDDELEEEFVEFIEEILNDPETRQTIGPICGEDKIGFIIRAVNVFAEKRTQLAKR